MNARLIFFTTENKLIAEWEFKFGQIISLSISSKSFNNIFSEPNAPSIKSQDQLTAVTMNRFSITLIGSRIDSSDAYAVVGLLENGTRHSNFSRVQSFSADDNVTLVNLLPGKSYTLEVVSVFGTITDCGRGNATDSEILALNICTG